MTNDDDIAQKRVVKLADRLLAVLAGHAMNDAHTALTLTVVATIINDGDPATRVQAGEGFSRAVRDMLQRDDIVEWIKASTTPLRHKITEQ